MIGKQLGRYRIIEQMGEGGMAVVYKGYDQQLDRYVAVKVILPQHKHSEHFIKRFESEAKSVARLTHPNIVGVIDYGNQDDMPYLVMEFVPGGTLKNMLGEPMSWRAAAKLLTPVASALEYAHQENIFHRDIKPSNILITSTGEPMLTDFGIAKILRAEDVTKLTQTGEMLGTPAYMSPEQCQGEEVDARSDVYSLGIVFYEMITGRTPFRADTPIAVAMKQVGEQFPFPREFSVAVPEIVEQFLLKALAKDPDHRFQSMGAFANALEKLALGISPFESMPMDQTKTLMASDQTIAAFPDETVSQPSIEVPDQNSAGQPRRSIFDKVGSNISLLVGVPLFTIVVVALLWIFRDDLAHIFQPSESIQAMETIAIEITRTPTQIEEVETPTVAVAIIEKTKTSTSRPTRTPIKTPTSRPTARMSPHLTLDVNAFCRGGPGTIYDEIWTFNAGSRLEIIGKDSNGWWLIQFDDPGTRHDKCWVGVGVVEGDTSIVPFSSFRTEKGR